MSQLAGAMHSLGEAYAELGQARQPFQRALALYEAVHHIVGTRQAKASLEKLDRRT